MPLRLSHFGRLAGVAAATISLIVCAGGSLAGADTVSAPVHVAFLGDSYTYGVGATEVTNGYAYLVARAEHWSADVIGLPGSGYVRIATHDHMAISAGIASVIAAQPDVVVVESGHNDADPGIPAADVEPDALKDLQALHTGLPYATIVVLGPIWLTGYPDERALGVRDSVHAAQREIPGSRWVDPIAQKWFTGGFRHKTGDDATMINYAAGHPNDRGYEHIAQLLEANLHSLGVS